MSRSLVRQTAFATIIALAAVGAWEVLRGSAASATSHDQAVALPDHFVCYRITGETPPPRTVIIDNQFERSQVTVFGRTIICAPTYKTPIKLHKKVPEIEP